ncbi:MAG: hypothetical protein LBU77_01660 [Clostridiales bacterium]|jgi:hypothetical protein|nr:hypothetical protein [Clostridiales bacterium]
MGFLDELFVSREERERKENAYMKKVLPLGPGQKEAALALLKPLIGAVISDPELFYFFLVAKERFLDEKKLPEIRRYLKKHGSFKDHDIKTIISVAVLDSRAESVEAYPSLEDVKAFGAEYDDLMMQS